MSQDRGLNCKYTLSPGRLCALVHWLKLVLGLQILTRDATFLDLCHSCSNPFRQSPGKVRCDLCLLYFVKDSVNGVISFKRILDLRRKCTAHPLCRSKCRPPSRTSPELDSNSRIDV